MKLHLYVEDRNFKAYETLARTWHTTNQGHCEVNSVKAVTLRLDRMRADMYKYVVRAQYEGFNCIVFVLDQEATHDRLTLIGDIHAAFERLCSSLRDDCQLQAVKVGLVIAKSCLECWLLTDVQAVVHFACRRGKIVNYSPAQAGDTERFSPNEAADKITQILREVSKRQGKHETKRIKYEKSAVADMIPYMDELPRAVNRNRSLAYYCEMVTCERSGCDYPQPDSEF